MLPTTSMLDTLERRFGLTWLSHGGDQINVRCPYCHKRGMREDASGHLGINTRLNKAHCVRCGWGHGNAASWLEKFDIHITVSVVDVIRETDSLKKIFDKKKVQFDSTTTPLPKEFSRITKDQNDSFTESLTRKGISIGQMLSNGIGYCESGAYDGYVIFPFLEDGEVVYFQGRAAYPDLLSDPKKKKKNPESRNGMGKNAWLYGIHRAKKGCKMVLVEGTLDQISAQSFFDRNYDNVTVVSIQGTSLSFPSPDRHPLNSQWGKIAYFDPEEVMVMLDDDAYKKAVELSNILSLTGFRSRAIRVIGGDPNEVSRLEDGDDRLKKAVEGTSEFDQIKQTLELSYA